MKPSWTGNILNISIITLIVEDGITKIGVVDEMLVDLIKNNSNEMRNIHDDESEHGDSIDNPHKFIGVDLGIDNTEETVHLNDLQSIEDV